MRPRHANPGAPDVLTVETRQAARRRGPWDVVERGALNPMWAAMSNLLATTPEERADNGALPT